MTIDHVCPFCGRDPYHRINNGVGMEAVAVNCCDFGYFLSSSESDEITVSRGEFQKLAQRLDELKTERDQFEQSYRCYSCKRLFEEDHGHGLASEHFGDWLKGDRPKCEDCLRGTATWGGGPHDPFYRVRKETYDTLTAENKALTVQRDSMDGVIKTALCVLCVLEKRDQQPVVRKDIEIAIAGCQRRPLQHRQWRWGMSSAGTYNPTVCCYCNGHHIGKCPLVKAFEYFPDGTLKRVEFYEPQPVAVHWHPLTGQAK